VEYYELAKISGALHILAKVGTSLYQALWRRIGHGFAVREEAIPRGMDQKGKLLWLAIISHG
jgi:hypothetical protein